MDSSVSTSVKSRKNLKEISKETQNLPAKSSTTPRLDSKIGHQVKKFHSLPKRRDILVRSVTEADPDVGPIVPNNKTSSLPERKTSLNNHHFLYDSDLQMKIESQVEEDLERHVAENEIKHRKWKSLKVREHPSKCISNGNGHSSVRTQVSRDSTSKQPSLRRQTSDTKSNEFRTKCDKERNPADCKTWHDWCSDESKKVDQGLPLTALYSDPTAILSSLNQRRKASFSTQIHEHSHQIMSGHEQCQHHHFHHHHHHYHFHNLTTDNSSLNATSHKSLSESAKQFQFSPTKVQIEKSPRQTINDPADDVRHVVNQILMQLTTSSGSNQNQQSTSPNNTQIKSTKQDRSLKHFRVLNDAIRSSPSSPRSSSAKRDRPVRTSSAENTSPNKNRVTTSQHPTQLSTKDKTAWIEIAASLKSKMTSSSEMQDSKVVDVSDNLNLPSGHHRSGSRHDRRVSQHYLDSSMRQHSQPSKEELDEMQSNQHFDMSQIQQSMTSMAADHPDSKLRLSRTRSISSSTPNEADVGVKKDRIKTLWGKAGKQGAIQTTTTDPNPLGVAPTKWDQILNPMLQKQKQERLLVPGDPGVASYFNTTVGGEVGSGSGFYGQPGNATMECDCGDDSCPQCNLMLNMGSGY